MGGVHPLAELVVTRNMDEGGVTETFWPII